jgi:tyrosinase
MPTGAPNVQNPSVPLRYRASVTDLTEAQLAELRAAFADMEATADDRGYQYEAGIHGLPLPAWCDRHGHGTPTFVHWHRAYLHEFEMKLRAAGHGHDVMVPWWDWLTTPEIPAAYADQKDADGNENPLLSVEVNAVALEQGKRGAIPGDEDEIALSRQPNTARNPGLPGTKLPTRADIAKVLKYSDFASFTQTLEDWHGQVHVWVGGHMGDIPFAAYDPIFWAHHAMIDRIWRLWQLEHPDASSLPSSLDDEVMQPFGMTASQTLDVTVLGYDYAVSSTTVPVAS